jgi:hypothetical protein
MSEGNGFAMTRTCSECPWLRSSAVGRFGPDRYEALANSCKPGWLRPVFACHKTPEGDGTRACAGMLLVVGRDSNAVRLALMKGVLDLDKIEASGPLYDSFIEMAVANGCDPDAPEFEGL